MPMPILDLAYGTKVVFHPYRTASVINTMFELNRETDEVREFERKLAAAAGVSPDNHSCYELKIGGEQLVIMFTDFTARVGRGLLVGDW